MESMSDILLTLIFIALFVILLIYLPSFPPIKVRLGNKKIKLNFSEKHLQAIKFIEDIPTSTIILRKNNTKISQAKPDVCYFQIDEGDFILTQNYFIM